MEIVAGFHEQQNGDCIKVTGVVRRKLYQGQKSSRTDIVSGLEEQQRTEIVSGLEEQQRTKIVSWLEEWQDGFGNRIRGVAEEGDCSRSSRNQGIRLLCLGIIYFISLRWEFNSSNTIRPLHPDSSGIATYTPFTGFYLYNNALRSFINIMYIKILKITQHKT